MNVRILLCIRGKILFYLYVYNIYDNFILSVYSALCAQIETEIEIE